MSVMADLESTAAAALTGHTTTGLRASQPRQSSVEENGLDDEGDFEPFSPRRGHTHKRAEEPPKNEAGKMTCKFGNTCPNVVFERRCEWSKHMDKHERPYKCEHTGCEKLQGFTYSGGLLRHQREVHKMHGGTKEPLFCPFENCKRNAGAGFTRKENLHEHVRRVHRRNTDGSDLTGSEKRNFDAMDDITDPLLRGPDVTMQSDEAAGDENIDPNVMATTPASSPNKRRRLTQSLTQVLTQTNGTAPADTTHDSLTEIKSQLAKVVESNRFLVQQNSDIRRELHSLTERLNKMENQIGRRLMGE